jgi:hypothetical protein
VDSCTKAEPREQMGLTLYTLANRLQKQKSRSNPYMVIFNFIGYFTLVLCDFSPPQCYMTLLMFRYLRFYLSAMPSLPPCYFLRTQAYSVFFRASSLLQTHYVPIPLAPWNFPVCFSLSISDRSWDSVMSGPKGAAVSKCLKQFQDFPHPVYLASGPRAHSIESSFPNLPSKSLPPSKSLLPSIQVSVILSSEDG